MPIAPNTTTLRRFQFSPRAMLLVLGGVAIYCAFRSWMFRSEAMYEAVTRAAWGRTFFAIAGGTCGAWMASRQGVNEAMILARGTIWGCASATLFYTTLCIEVPALGEVYADPFEWSRFWPDVVERILFHGTILGAIFAAPAAIPWMFLPARRN